MTSIPRVWLTVFLLAVLAAPALAQDPLASKVTVDLKAVAPDQAFRVVGNTIGMKVTVDPKVTSPIDILLRDVSARTALSTMCESIGCAWSVDGGVILVKPAGERAGTVKVTPAVVSAMPRKTGDSVEQKKALLDRLQAAMKQTLPAGLAFDNAPLAVVSAKLSEVTGLTIVLSTGNPAVTTLTADLSGQTLMSALQTLGKSDPGMIALRLAVSDKGSSGAPSVMLGFKVDGSKK